MKTAKKHFWKGLAEVGKNILAHVNITYDGASGAIRIDIVPANQPAIGQEPPTVIAPQQTPELLPSSARNETSEKEPSNKEDTQAVEE